MEFIDNQPFIFRDRNEYQLCKNDDTRCNIVQPGDVICVQIKNPPCIDTTNEFICDNEFGVFNSADLVTNGQFDGSSTPWTVGGTWSYDAGVMHTESPDVSSSISQTMSQPLVADGCYVVKFTVLNYVEGSLLATLGGTNLPLVTADGEYSFLVTTAASDDLLYLTSSPPCDFDVDNVQVFYLGDCWCADNGNITPAGTTGICHIPGAETTVNQVTPPLTAGAFYKIYISIRNMTQGSVKCYLGNPTSTIAFTTNGDFVDYVAATNTDFSINMSSDFDGCVTYVGVVEYNRCNEFWLVDEDDNEVYDFAPVVIYYQDRAFFCFMMDDIRDSMDQPFAYGCYRLKLVDCCTNNEYFSNCINYQQEFPGTRVITACDWVDGDASDFRYSFGFVWVRDFFTLSQRVMLHFRKPTWINKFDGDRFSTGSRYKSYVEEGKWWEMVVEELDETQLDCLNTQIQTRDWGVDGVRYYTKDEEFSPNWDDPGMLSLADVKINVSRKDGIIFSDNCSR